MRISTFGYSMKQGVKNIGRNKMFSIASIATMAACIFLFGLFYSIVINLNYIVEKAEEGVAITVFFNDDATQEQKDEIGSQLEQKDGVLEVNYISAEDAWDKFQDDYFGESKDAAEGFKNDNPLANSDSYEVYMADVEGCRSFCRRPGGSPESQQIRCGGKDAHQREPADVLCVGRNHTDPPGGIRIPDQQYGNDGYHRAAGGDCNHEIYRSEGRVCPRALCDRRSSHWYRGSDYSAYHALFHV